MTKGIDPTDCAFEGSPMLGEIARELAGMDWINDDDAAHRAVGDMLTYAWNCNPDRLFAEIATRVERLPPHVVTRQGELISHCLYQDNGADGQGIVTLKLNKFVEDQTFPGLGRRSLSIHNHTRTLSSLTLNAGYASSEYDAAKDPSEFEVGEEWLGQLDERVMPRTKPGHFHTMGPECIHGLTDFGDGTWTLAVYGNFVRPGITLFNQLTGKVERRERYETAQKKVVAELRGLGMQCQGDVTLAERRYD